HEMKTFRVASIAATLLACACAHASPRQEPDACRLAQAAQQRSVVRVPFELVDGRIYVQAKVNDGGPYRFAVDTGASGMGRADATLVEALGLRMAGQALNSDGVQTATADTTRLHSLALGELVRRDLEVITRDYNTGKPEEQHFAGIIGREFFRDGMLVIDYPNRMLAFSTAVGMTADTDGSIGYARPFRVPVSIAGLHVTGHLDTGANVTAVFPKSLYEDVAATALEAAGKGRLSNGSMAISRAVIDGPMQIGSARLVDLEVRVSDTFPELLIGAHVLRHYVLAIDQRSSRVALCGPGETLRD
ncbi:MAG: retroviral-like aspartic protease family protein, partial [Thermomonas sp.]|uniref:retroviral-like aspartic protease family protein n=1 Tax=Thermomonas sp. TaxID=1971895 RepID=UPI0039E3D09F